jgi:hypothetical protein
MEKGKKMIDYTITKKDARKIFLSRLTITIPATLFGICAGLYQSSNRINFADTFKFVLPITLVLISIPVYIGIQIGITRLTNTNLKLDDNSITETKPNGEIIQFDLSEITFMKENLWGLTIKKNYNKIFIHKQLPVFGEIKKVLGIKSY